MTSCKGRGKRLPGTTRVAEQDLVTPHRGVSLSRDTPPRGVFISRHPTEGCLSQDQGVAPMLLPQSRPMWLSKFRRDRDRQGRKRPRRRLAVHSLECLEDRTVLSSISVGPMDTAGLYRAIAAANAATGPATVNISLSPGTYTLTGAQLEITRTSGAVTIHGNGAVIDAAGLSRVL